MRVAILYPPVCSLHPTGYFRYAQHHPGDTFQGVILFRVTGFNLVAPLPASLPQRQTSPVLGHARNNQLLH